MYNYGLWDSELAGVLKGWQNFPEELKLTLNNDCRVVLESIPSRKA